MEKLQLFFSNTRSLASYCVRFATWGEYGHVGLYRDDTIIEANSTMNKVVCRSFDPKEYSQFVIKEYDIPAKPVWDIISSQIDKPYDWSAIYGFLFRQDCVIFIYIIYIDYHFTICNKKVKKLHHYSNYMIML